MKIKNEKLKELLRKLLETHSDLIGTQTRMEVDNEYDLFPFADKSIGNDYIEQLKDRVSKIIAEILEVK